MSKIKEQFNHILEESQDIVNPQTDDLFKQWSKNKMRFIDAWGGLTYTTPEEVEIENSEEGKEKVFDDFKEWVWTRIRFKDLSDKTAHTRATQAFEWLKKQKKEALFENRVKKQPTKNDPPVGMKLTRALKHFFPNSEMLHEAQVYASRCIQENSMKGYLTLSVHPLDFLSLSENSHDWRSCMALNGEYRSGCLSYMADCHTIIVYMSSDKKQHISRFDDVMWNSKRWRVLAYIPKDKSSLIFGKQYPFKNDNLLPPVSSMICDTLKIENTLLPSRMNASWLSSIMVNQQGTTATIYNDVLDSWNYKKEVMGVKFSPSKEVMQIGGIVKCLDCGEHPIEMGDTMTCARCGDYTYCDSCGRAEYIDDTYHLSDEDLCESCFEDNVVYCFSCGEALDIRYEDDLCYYKDDYCCYSCYEACIEEDEDDEESLDT